MANRRCRKRLNAEQQRGKSGELRCASWQWVHRGPEAGGSALQGRMGTGGLDNSVHSNRLAA